MPRRAALASLVLAVTMPLGVAGSAAAAPVGPTVGPRHDGTGLSRPQEDSYYPAKGDPGIDTLHYGLDLTWNRRARVLEGTARIRLRATADSSRVLLDLSRRMTVRQVRMDGRVVAFGRPGAHLSIEAPVDAGSRHTLRVSYAGTPAPTRGPASRRDVARVGMRVTSSGELWTMQEPFGALTWYPVNDHPSDKAMYDVRVSTPGRWVGVSTGRLVRRMHEGGRTRTRWTNADPMASYLMTLAVGPYRVFRQRGPHDLPLTYWVPRSRPQLVRPLLRTPKALRWLESRLGPYPFDRAGVVVVPGTGSAMETQTLVTFGAGRYRDDAFSVRETMVHELAHQWYGDAVTPRDWRDLWLNEGMATYLDARWAVDQGRGTWRGHVRSWASQDQLLRDVYGPPGDFLRDEFASNNVYYCTALMWERLRLRLGDGTFDRLVRAWPQQHRNTNQTRRSYVAWIEAETGEELTSFFRRWLTSSTSPIG